MIGNLIAFMVCVIGCIYTGLHREAAESVIYFILAAVNLAIVIVDLWIGGRYV